MVDCKQRRSIIAVKIFVHAGKWFKTSNATVAPEQ
jgi:hypothetical protein